MDFTATDTTLFSYIIYSIIGLAISFTILFFTLKRIGKDPRYILPVNFANKIRLPLALFITSLTLRIGIAGQVFDTSYSWMVNRISALLLILSVTWLLVVLVRVVKKGFIKKYDITAEDNLRARRIYTQFNILERVVVFLIIVFAIGIALLSFESIRAVGVSFLTSAGIAGIILGFSAQKALGTLMAGIQIAITQPIRLDDVVIVEGEWGKIEEITLTYVVIAIWDKRRLVVPTTYFIEKPFQNWTRTTAEILGIVYIYADYGLPVDKLRDELTRLLEGSPLWDGKVNVLQVTNANEHGMELRALMSSRNSSISWDLRVYVREKLIQYIQEKFPENLPRARVVLKEEPPVEKPDVK